MTTEFGDRARAARKAKGLTLGDLAYATGITVTQVSMIEVGVKLGTGRPNADDCRRVAEFLGIHGPVAA